MDLIWQTHMLTLTRRILGVTSDELVVRAIEDYYESIGQDVPNWRCPRDPQWWIDYLASLEDK